MILVMNFLSLYSLLISKITFILKKNVAYPLVKFKFTYVRVYLYDMLTYNKPLILRLKFILNKILIGLSHPLALSYQLVEKEKLTKVITTDKSEGAEVKEAKVREN